MDILQIREQIDDIDQQLLALFAQRMELTKAVGKEKAAASLPIYNPDREQEILEKVKATLPQELGDYGCAWFSSLFQQSRAYQGEGKNLDEDFLQQLQETLEKTPPLFPVKAVVACQGVVGAYSQLAADKAFPFADILYFKNFKAVFGAVEQGLCRYGVLPIENSSYGSVNAVYDLMRTRRFSIVKEVKLPIHHNLLVNPGTRLSQVKEIISHEQALGQCSDFLSAMPEVKLTCCENTAVAAEKLAASGRNDQAAISSPDCAAIYGLETLKERIQNSDQNCTRFIVISAKPEIHPEAHKISILFTTDNKPGALQHILTRFSQQGINLSKLESRPQVDSAFQYVFYADLDADPKDPLVQRLLAQLSGELEFFLLLGAYQEV